MLGLLTNLFGNIVNILIGIPITLIALSGHELAHGFVSYKLGDPTPRQQGRLTLNPLAHLDLVGTMLMVLTGFGWAKPVMVDPRYYKNQKRGMALTALAGPLANLVMAFLALLIFSVFIAVCGKLGADMSSGTNVVFIQTVWRIVFLFVYRNLCFMVFNLIPIPPLDGSKVLGIFLPGSAYYKMLQYERYAIILIMLLSLVGAFDKIIGTGVNIILTGMANLFGLF